MKKRFVTILAAVLCLVLTMTCACAEDITLSGKIIPTETIQIYAPISGTVEGVAVEAGQKIGAEDEIYTMKTTKIYADHDGTVSGVFGQAGDDAETVTSRYGAVIYLEEYPAYTVSASTSGAYNSMDTKYVHPGEHVYVISRNSVSRYGEGTITSVSGTEYSIEISEGVFLTGESVEVFRDPEYDYHTRIGKGTVTHSDPLAVTGGSGAIVSIAVEKGQEVKRGDLLMETLDGTFAAYNMTGTTITAGQTGVVGSISVSAGGTVSKDTVAAEIYPLDRMRVEANLPEDYINLVHEGDPVTVELSTDMSKRFEGTVVMISSIATEGEEEVTYRIVAEFVPDETVRFGMTALITAGEEEEPEEPEEEPEAEKEEEPEAEAEEEISGKRERPEWNGEGERPEWNGEGERPEMPEGSSFGGRAEDAPEASGETPEAQTETNP